MGRKRLRNSKKMKEPILNVMAGSIHTYNLVMIKTQNDKTVVVSTAIDGLNQLHCSQIGAKEPYKFTSVGFARSSSDIHEMFKYNLDSKTYLR
jgi:hypothetical protein